MPSIQGVERVESERKISRKEGGTVGDDWIFFLRDRVPTEGIRRQSIEERKVSRRESRQGNPERRRVNGRPCKTNAVTLGRGRGSPYRTQL